MTHCFIISSDKGGFGDSTKMFVENNTIFEPVLIDLKPCAKKSRSDVFKFIERKISNIPSNELLNSVVLVDHYFIIKNSNPARIDGNIDNENELDHLYGMLILSFPELRFLFLNQVLENENIIDWIENECEENKEAFDPLFDGTKLRNAIRENVNNKSKGENNRSIALFLRNDLKARVIEDELSYAYFHSYILYKRDHTCKLYSTLNHLNQDRDVEENVNTQIQDLCLGFVDKDSKTNLLKIEDRFKEFPFLKHRCKDYIITISKDKVQSEINILNKKSINGTQIKSIDKPSKGVYDIEKKMGLKAREDINNDVSKSNNHSAPGMLALIAEKLIDRSQDILNTAKNVTNAIHAATLALEAKELLNGLTPTLAFQAFSLQQQAEVTAECMFAGTEYNIELKPRFDDIDREVTIIAKQFDEKQRRKVELNAQLSIVENISGIYGSFKQFEEENKSLHEARIIHIKLNNRFLWRLFKPIHWATNSFIKLALSIAIIQIPFALIYYCFLTKYLPLLEDCTKVEVENELALSISSSLKFFFTSETSKTFESVFEQAGTCGNVVLFTQGAFSLASLTLAMALVIRYLDRK